MLYVSSCNVLGYGQFTSQRTGFKDYKNGRDSSPNLSLFRQSGPGYGLGLERL